MALLRPCGRVVGVIDPQHGLVAARRSEALDDAAVAPQHPDFVAALLPAVGGLGGDDDRLGPAELGQVDGGRRRSGGQRDQHDGKQQADVRATPPASAVCAAHWRPAEFFPGGLSRLASLLYRLDGPESGRLQRGKLKRQQSLRKVPGIERANYNGEPQADQGGLGPGACDATPCRQITSVMQSSTLRNSPPAATMAEPEKGTVPAWQVRAFEEPPCPKNP